MRSKEREILSVLLPFVLQYASHSYRSASGKILVVVVTGIFPKDRIDYASWGPIFWSFLRSSERDPTTKAVRGTVAVKGVFDSINWRCVAAFPFLLQGLSKKPARHSVTNGGLIAVQIGGVLPVLFRQVVRAGGS